MTHLEPDKSAGSKIRVACAGCSRETNHLVLRSIEASGSVGEEYHWKTSYQIIQCQGCDTISFRSLSTNSEDIVQTGPNDWEHAEDEHLYPSRTEGRQPLSDYYLLPNDLERIYRETIAALNADQPVLGGMGIRAIIETVAKEKSANGKDLFERINSLVTEGVLTKDGADILHQLRVLGNNAAHEVKAHGATELKLAMDVLEHLLQAVYILPFHAKRTFK